MEIATASIAFAVMQPPDVSGGPVVKAAQPDGLAAARFSELMGLDATPASLPSSGVAFENTTNTVYTGVQTQAHTPVLQVAPDPNASIGDRILSGMQGLSNDVQQSWATVKSALDNTSNMTTADMLKLQMGLTQMSIQYDLVGKAISRSTQNLDQLLKMQ